MSFAAPAAGRRATATRLRLLTQCTAKDRFAPSSLWMVIASAGEQCCSFMNHAGSCAPIGIAAAQQKKEKKTPQHMPHSTHDATAAVGVVEKEALPDRWLQPCRTPDTQGSHAAVVPRSDEGQGVLMGKTRTRATQCRRTSAVWYRLPSKSSKQVIRETKHTHIPRYDAASFSAATYILTYCRSSSTLPRSNGPYRSPIWPKIGQYAVSPAK